MIPWIANGRGIQKKALAELQSEFQCGPVLTDTGWGRAVALTHHEHRTKDRRERWAWLGTEDLVDFQGLLGVFGVFSFRAVEETLHFGDKFRVQIVDVLLRDGVLGHRLDSNGLADLHTLEKGCTAVIVLSFRLADHSRHLLTSRAMRCLCGMNVPHRP